MIDLHTHTNESDGTYTPAELLDAARKAGLEALAITDHDTFAGYDQALAPARETNFDLVCGIELSTRFAGRRDYTVHLLGYFLKGPPADEFRAWLQVLLEERRDRNRRLVERLRSIGVDIELSEVEALGRTLTGRPHFARALVAKGYARSAEDAFRKYLGETAPSFVERQGPSAAKGIRQIAEAGGLPVLAHPIRLGIRDATMEEQVIGGLRDAGLQGLEVYHSDHRAPDMERYASIAKKLDLAVTGGSDFHGTAKPAVSLGTGIGRALNVPREVLDRLRGA